MASAIAAASGVVLFVLVITVVVTGGLVTATVWPDGEPGCDGIGVAGVPEFRAHHQALINYDYAVRAIKKEHNETAGCRYGAWLGGDRILDGDPFFVRITP